MRVWFSCSGFEPSVVLITWYSSVIRGKAGLCVPCSCPTSWLRCWSGSNMVAPLPILVAYAFMNISCFTLTWLRSPAWRPTGIHRIVKGSRLSTFPESVGRLLGLLPCHVVRGVSVLGLVMCLVATVILMMVLLLMCLLLLYAWDVPEGLAKPDATYKEVTATRLRQAPLAQGPCHGSRSTRNDPSDSRRPS